MSSRVLLFSSEAIEALKWFISLPIDKQLYAITQVFSEKKELDIKLSEKEQGYLVTILDEIAIALGRHATDAVVGELLTLEMDETVAKVLVDKMKGARPPAYVHVRVLRDLDAQRLKILGQAILVDVYEKGEDLQTVVSKTQLPYGSARAVLFLFRDYILFAYLRGDISLEKAEATLVNYGFDAKQAKVFRDLLVEHGDVIGRLYLFKNVQDIWFKMDDLSKSVDKVWVAIRELVDMLKKYSKPSGYIG